MTTSSLLPRSVALSLLLVAGSALAAPAKSDNMIQRFGKSVSAGYHYTKADLAQRNAKAGPNMFQRAMTNTKAHFQATKASIRETAATVREGLHEARINTVQGFRDAHANLKIVSADLRAGIKAKTQAAVANTRAFGIKVATGTKNIATKTKDGIVRTADRVVAAHEQRVAYRAADRDFKVWLNEPGNETARTYYKGAAKEQHIGGLKAARVGSALVTGANTAAALAGSPLNAALVPWSMNASYNIKGAIKTAKRSAAESTLNKFMGSSLSAERLASWSKAGYVDPSLAD